VIGNSWPWASIASTGQPRHLSARSSRGPSKARACYISTHTAFEARWRSNDDAQRDRARE
jgi:hypothetical protein